MSGFKRSPSKVWWTEDNPSWRLRSASASPGSQDSGFSDTEASPPCAPQQQATSLSTPKASTTPQRIPKDIFKETTPDDNNIRRNNLTRSYREKCVQDKKSINLMSRSWDAANVATPVKTPTMTHQSEPSRKQLYQKNSSKAINRNLFDAKVISATARCHQYAIDAPGDSSKRSDISSEVTFEESDSSIPPESVQSLPSCVPDGSYHLQWNRSAPAVLEVLRENETVESLETESFSSSESDSELEDLFRGSLESPKHTSTPKSAGTDKMRHYRRRMCHNLRAKCQKERIPPTDPLAVEDNSAVQRWIREVRFLYEPECMTALQSKSIAGELNQKVLALASKTTSFIREVLAHSQLVEKEFSNLQKQIQYICPLAQNLVGIISEFIQNYTKDSQKNPATQKLCEALRCAIPEEIPELISQIYSNWKEIQTDILVRETANLAEKLENPASELDLRAILTGITSLSLRHEHLVELFVKAGVVPNLLVLCEKCDGSSVRMLILRALTTVCCNGTAVKQLEKSSGVQLIADTLEDQSRPEPELSESVALLAQITAPWIEDGHKLRGVEEEGRKLVKGLTKFIASTKCCQNLLLCTAALANLTSMNTRCVRYVLQQNAIRIVFEAVKNRGVRASVYLLEQVATLLANISANEEARRQLTKERAAAILLCFLRGSEKGEDVEKRLQQKAVIALSRLSSDKKAARQIVELGGVDKLVRICREKNERYNSDAVLVAALATLRKVVDACGSSIINSQDAQELVEPKLLDSFLAYSTQNESYV